MIYTPEKNVDAGNITRPLLPTLPNRASVNRTGSTDPEVIVAVDRLVLAICGWSTTGEVSEG